RVRRGDNDNAAGSACLRGEDHPVDEPATKKRVQMLRQRGAHPRSQPGGHHNGCKRRVCHGINGWGARIRTWDRGTKTRCLTAWLRPTAREYRPRLLRDRMVAAVALGEQVDQR